MKYGDFNAGVGTYCDLDSTDDTKELIRCIVSSADIGARQFARDVLLVFAAALVFFMQAGFAMVCAGAVRRKNVQNSMLKNLLDACGASLAYFLVGFAFSFGGMDEDSAEKTFIGKQNFFMMDVDDPAFWLFHFSFSAAAATITAGALAERCQMVAYLCYSVVLSGWVYPIIVHAIWNAQGFLSAFSVDPLWGVGMVDFAGSGVVHLTGGVTALFATSVLGPRRGRFHDEAGRRLAFPVDIPGHSVALQMLGTFILWFGWYGFNSGSALLIGNENTGKLAAIAAVNSTLAAGVAGVTALFANLWYLEKTTGEAVFELKYAMNGTLAGLVAVTGGCGVIEPWAAVLIGFVAGLLYLVGSRWLIRLRLDDAVDAIPVHMVNGIWGLVAVGFFASPSRLEMSYGRSDHAGWFYSVRKGDPGDMVLLSVQLVGILFIIGWVLIFMFPFFVWLDWKGWFRADPLEELVGLDTSYHGGLALLVQHESIDPEYITAFKERRQQTGLRRRNGLNWHTTSETIEEVQERGDDEDDL